VYVGVYAHTHTLHVGYSDMSLGVWTRHLKSPKNPGGLNHGIYVFVYVYREDTYIYMVGGSMPSESELTSFLFQHISPSEKEKQKMRT